MTEVTGIKKNIRLNIEEGGISAVTINGTKIAEISTEGDVVTFRYKGTQLAMPAT